MKKLKKVTIYKQPYNKTLSDIDYRHKLEINEYNYRQMFDAFHYNGYFKDINGFKSVLNEEFKYNYLDNIVDKDKGTWEKLCKKFLNQGRYKVKENNIYKFSVLFLERELSNDNNKKPEDVLHRVGTNQCYENRVNFDCDKGGNNVSRSLEQDMLKDDKTPNYDVVADLYKDNPEFYKDFLKSIETNSLEEFIFTELELLCMTYKVIKVKNTLNNLKDSYERGEIKKYRYLAYMRIINNILKDEINDSFNTCDKINKIYDNYLYQTKKRFRKVVEELEDQNFYFKGL